VSDMNRALLLVDMSNDFIQLDGALNCGQPGIDIVPYCAGLVDSFLARREYVVDARDDHDLTDYEIATGLFPAHNIVHTKGQELIPELHERLQNHQELVKYIPKKTYNATYETDLLAFLTAKNITEVHIVGVCTDICVRYTVNGLYEWKAAVSKNLRVVVHQDGVASFNAVGHRDSLTHFAQVFGVDVV